MILILLLLLSSLFFYLLCFGIQHALGIFFYEKKNRDFDGFSIFGYMYTPDILSIHKKELNFILCLVPIVIPHCPFINITLFHCSELIKYLGFLGPVYNLEFSSFFQL